MPFTYHQRSGAMEDPLGNRIAQGYSGDSTHRNDPATEAAPFVGTIPAGRYRMIHDRNSTRGRYVIRLIPVGHNARGRTDLLVHGDNPNTIGNSSQGCIVINGAEIRRNILNNGDDELDVVE